MEKIENWILRITISPPLEIPIQSNTFHSMLQLTPEENGWANGIFIESIFHFLNPNIWEMVEIYFCLEYFVNMFLPKELSSSKEGWLKSLSRRTCIARDLFRQVIKLSFLTWFFSIQNLNMPYVVSSSVSRVWVVTIPNGKSRRRPVDQAIAFDWPCL